MLCGLRNSGEEVAGIFGEMGFRNVASRDQGKGSTYRVIGRTVKRVGGSQDLLLFLSWKYPEGPEKREIVRVRKEMGWTLMSNDDKMKLFFLSFFNYILPKFKVNGKEYEEWVGKVTKVAMIDLKAAARSSGLTI